MSSIKKIVQEVVENVAVAKGVFNKIIDTLRRINDGSIKNSDIQFYEYDIRALKMEFNNIPAHMKGDIEKTLVQQKKEAEKLGLVLSYKIYDRVYNPKKEAELNGFADGTEEDRDIPFNQYVMHIKKDRGNRIIPPKYVYHTTSPKNRQKFLKNGIEPRAFEDGNWTLEGTGLGYGPSIFVSFEEGKWSGPFRDADTWKIDTTVIPNKWYEDLNTVHLSDKAEAMTFDPIPPEAIELVKKQ